MTNDHSSQKTVPGSGGGEVVLLLAGGSDTSTSSPVSEGTRQL